MKIDVARLDEEGERFVGADPASILDWDPTDDVLVPAAPVEYDLRAEALGTELLVRGRVWTRFGGFCARCGDALDFEVRDDNFCVSIPLDEDAQEVDLTPELRESILLLLPSHPVCRAECSGLCPRCGRRLAEGVCGCAAPPARGWEALAGLEVPPTRPS